MGIPVLCTLLTYSVLRRRRFSDGSSLAGRGIAPSASVNHATASCRGRATELTALTVEPPSTEQVGASESEFYHRRETKVSPFRHQAVLTPSCLCLSNTLMIILVHSHPQSRWKTPRTCPPRSGGSRMLRGLIWEKFYGRVQMYDGCCSVR